jgi:hypothetical protein
LENLQKQRFFLKPHNRTSFTWAFYNINNNQPMDLDHNQIMICVICHHDFIGPEILAMHIKCNKRLITYHKNNGITTMKK